MSDRAKIRDDFIRRLFAVAVSVGFATTLIRMDWVEFGNMPTKPEWEQLAILVTGMVLTVLSWDGYLASIKDKPLYGYPRFWIDITLVFIYMFFLISSRHSEFWLNILVVVFFLYVIWDALTVREHVGKYDASLLPVSAADTYRAKWPDVGRVYIRGILDDSRTYRGPVVTLSWAVYFSALAWINHASATRQVFVMCGFAIIGLVLYRRDKVTRFGAATVSGAPMWLRVIVIVLLLGASALYFFYFSSAPRP